MTRRLLLCAIALLVCAGFGCSSTGKPQSSSAARLRVMTYNIHHAAGMDTKLDVKRIGGVVNDATPELVALQEVDVGTSRSEKKDEPKELATFTAMHSAFGKAIDVGGGDYGNAVLSRWPILSQKVVQLPKTAAREQRVALITR